jgi:glycosyltransferase involved in cell wall biosynthesis
MPILEALACGTPVICSRIPAFQEVAGDAGRFFDAEDAAEATAQVAAALLQARPFEQGVSHAHDKRWSDAARSTFEVLTTG